MSFFKGKNYIGEECMFAETVEETPTAGARGIAIDDDSDATTLTEHCQQGLQV